MSSDDEEEEEGEAEVSQRGPSSTGGGLSDLGESVFARRVSGSRHASASGLRAMLAPRRSLRAMGALFS